jgi:hypothetical protein
VPWKERKAWLADEEAQLRLRARSDQAGYQRDSPVDTAVGQVYEAVADDVSYWRGILSGTPEAVRRIRDRARLRATPNPLDVHVDRHGRCYVAFGDALPLAMAFCAAEPSTVLVDVVATERKWSQEVRHPGEEHLAGLLNEYRASWAVIRQWAGYDAAVAEQEAQIQKLERLVWDAVYTLQKAGLDKEAARLRRAIEPRSWGLPPGTPAALIDPLPPPAHPYGFFASSVARASAVPFGVGSLPVGRR